MKKKNFHMLQKLFILAQGGILGDEWKTYFMELQWKHYLSDLLAIV